MSDGHLIRQDSFALVTYTPEPLREWLIQLRQSLPVEATSLPHITVLPPRPLTLPADDAWQKITSTLREYEAFEVELSSVSVFPETNVLYLEISEGANKLKQLHTQLNSGAFLHEELFEFHPHLTVGGPVAASELAAIRGKAEQAWKESECPCRFKVEEFAFVSIATTQTARHWNRLWVHKLASAKAHQRAVGANFTIQTS